MPTHVVNEEKKTMKGGERCSFLLDAFTRGRGRWGGGGGVMIYFISLLYTHPLWPPPSFARFGDTRISSINVIKRGESSLAVINRLLQSSIFS